MHLARVFRDRLHTSVGGYVRMLRLQWAAHRIIETDDSIADIALEGGFADQSHFTRRFREHTGLTPGQYRRRRD
jgi:AraC-like DNA-binding protein